MKRKRTGLSATRSSGAKRRGRNSRVGRTFNAGRTISLGFEPLESRQMLSASPILTVVPNQLVNEGSPLVISNLGTFTDVVEGTAGGPSIGLNPANFTSLGAFNPASNVQIDTSTLTVSGGFSGTGTTVNADIGSGTFQIAVFDFSSFNLGAGITITASGSRPLAILSQSDITLQGTIDASATSDGDGFNGQRIAGPGGGDGGQGSALNSRHDGSPAAGAPANSVGQATDDPSFGHGGGTGAGFGGIGGGASVIGGSTSDPSEAGQAYANLALAIQGGSGGGTAGVGFFGGSGFLAGGGGGGGGVELGAVGTITITGSGMVLANGGFGRDGVFINPTGAGGGGAGGGILLHATNVTQHGLLSANGGNGGAGPNSGGGGGGGAVTVAYSTSGSFDNSGGTQSVLGGSAGGSFAQNGNAGVVNIVAQNSAVPLIETYDYTINWGDGSPADAGAATIDVPGVNIGDTVQGSFDGSHTYADDGLYSVTATVTGSAGGSDTKTFFVNASNVAPALTISGASDVNEGSSYTLNLSSFDPGTTPSRRGPLTGVTPRKLSPAIRLPSSIPTPTATPATRSVPPPPTKTARIRPETPLTLP